VGGGKLYILFTGENKPVQLYLRLTDMCTLNTAAFKAEHMYVSSCICALPHMKGQEGTH